MAQRLLFSAAQQRGRLCQISNPAIVTSLHQALLRLGANLPAASFSALATGRHGREQFVGGPVSTSAR